jgi:hypothetical protein
MEWTNAIFSWRRWSSSIFPVTITKTTTKSVTGKPNYPTTAKPNYTATTAHDSALIGSEDKINQKIYTEHVQL